MLYKKVSAEAIADKAAPSAHKKVVFSSGNNAKEEDHAGATQRHQKVKISERVHTHGTALARKWHTLVRFLQGFATWFLVSALHTCFWHSIR